MNIKQIKFGTVEVERNGDLYVKHYYIDGEETWMYKTKDTLLPLSNSDPLSVELDIELENLMNKINDNT